MADAWDPSRQASTDLGSILSVATIVKGATLTDPPNTPTAVDPEAEGAARIGTYHIVGRFPSSASTHVFLGHRTTRFGLLRRAVIKWAGRQMDDYENARSMLLDEARVTAFLDHPNLVRALDVGEDEAGLYLALEYVPGPDLRRVLKALRGQQSGMPQKLALYISIQVLRALAHAHRAVGMHNEALSIVHRDVNPSNVLLANTGHVRLTDFGMVHMKGRSQAPTAPHIIKGKFRYMAPEYIAQQELTLRADLYGVGLMLMEMLIGEVVFQGDEPTKIMLRIAREGVPYELMERAGVPPEIREIVATATALQPEKRFPSADAMAGALEHYLTRKGTYVSASTLGAFMLEQRLPQK